MESDSDNSNDSQEYFEDCAESLIEYHLAEENNRSEAEIDVQILEENKLWEVLLSHDRLRSQIWTKKIYSKRLIELYNKFITKIGQIFKSKYHMYQFIAEKLYEEFGLRCTPKQVASRKGKLVQKIRNLERQQLKNSNKTEEIRENIAYLHQNKVDLTDEQIRKIVRLYNAFLINFGKRKQFQTKKSIFEAISEELQYQYNIKYSWEQVEKQYKSIVLKSENQIRSRHFEFKNKKRNIELKKSVPVENFESISNSQFNPIISNEISSFRDNFMLDDLNSEKKEDDMRSEAQIPLDSKYSTPKENFSMQWLVKYQEEKRKKNLERHNELLCQLKKINETLSEIKQKQN